MTASQPLLELRGLQVAYGGIRAVRGIDLRVDDGELVCLIGANGAGKSSLFGLLRGTLHADQGDLDSVSYTHLTLPTILLV